MHRSAGAPCEPCFVEAARSQRWRVFTPWPRVQSRSRAKMQRTPRWRANCGSTPRSMSPTGSPSSGSHLGQTATAERSRRSPPHSSSPASQERRAGSPSGGRTRSTAASSSSSSPPRPQSLPGRSGSRGARSNTRHGVGRRHPVPARLPLRRRKNSLQVLRSDPNVFACLIAARLDHFDVHELLAQLIERNACRDLGPVRCARTSRIDVCSRAGGRLRPPTAGAAPSPAAAPTRPGPFR